jgi:hypothetical protein
MMRVFIAVVLLVPCLLLAQAEEKEDVWAPLKALLGEWEGSGGRGSIQSQIQARYNFVLNGNYIEVYHKAVFPPQEGLEAGETHEDKGFISYDRGRKKFVFRQFHIEGFVNQYVLDSLSTDGSTLFLNSEQIENAPPGTKANYVIKIINENEIETAFNVAFPGREYQCFSKNRLTKK